MNHRHPPHTGKWNSERANVTAKCTLPAPVLLRPPSPGGGTDHQEAGAAGKTQLGKPGTHSQPSPASVMGTPGPAAGTTDGVPPTATPSRFC